MQNTLTNNTVIICINWICSGWGDSFVKTTLETGQEGDIANAIFDRVGTPIDAEAASKAIMSILQGRVFKHPAFPISLLHFGNKGVYSWYEFAKKTIELAFSFRVLYIVAKSHPTSANHRCYSVFNRAKIKSTCCLSVPYCKDGLKQCVTALQGKASS